MPSSGLLVQGAPQAEDSGDFDGPIECVMNDKGQRKMGRWNPDWPETVSCEDPDKIVYYTGRNGKITYACCGYP